MVGRPRKQASENPGDGGSNLDPTGTDGGNSDLGSLAPGAIFIDPASVGQNSGSDGGGSGDIASEPRKRRGRKPGSRNTKSAPSLDISGLEKILLSAHTMLAAVTSPVMVIDGEEAKLMATGISNVARHYDVSATEKTLDWANLFMALGAVYGPRIMTMDWKRKPKAAAEKPTQTNGVAPMYVQPQPMSVPQ